MSKLMNKKVICPICTIEYTYQNKWKHNESFLHKLIELFKSDDDFKVIKKVKKEKAMDYLLNSKKRT